jgi:hypothetical protein
MEGGEPKLQTSYAGKVQVLHQRTSKDKKNTARITENMAYIS